MYINRDYRLALVAIINDNQSHLSIDLQQEIVSIIEESEKVDRCIIRENTKAYRGM